ncbi:MAG: hypothetical protein ABII90_06730 [Bacteroidota bacterium]
MIGLNPGINAQSKEEPIPEANIIDSVLETKIVETINKYAREKEWKEIFYKAIITSWDWSILRDFNTGIISGRLIDATLIAKWPDGHCTYREFKILQKFGGISYTEDFSRYSSTYPVECLCDGF